MTADEVMDAIVEAGAAVHKGLGAGFSEAIYHRAMEAELSERGLSFTSEGTIPIMYKGKPVGRRRPDLFVDDGEGGIVILELKAGSTSGTAQLDQYVSVLNEDKNYEITGAVLLQFNSSLDFSTSKQ